MTHLSLVSRYDDFRMLDEGVWEGLEPGGHAPLFVAVHHHLSLPIASVALGSGRFDATDSVTKLN